MNRKAEERRNKFMAAIQGINLDDGNPESAEEKFRNVQTRARARLSGRSEEEVVLQEIGFGYESTSG